MTTKTEKPADPGVVQVAEGSIVVPPAAANARPLPPPTPEEIDAEWNRWVAVVDIPYGTAIAIPQGGKVPASHPLFDQWKAEGLVEAAPKG